MVQLGMYFILQWTKVHQSMWAICGEGVGAGEGASSAPRTCLRIYSHPLCQFLSDSQAHQCVTLAC